MILNTWRTDPEFRNGSICPIINDKRTLDPLKRIGSSLKFVIATCDYEFLVKYISRLISYQSSPSQLPFLVGIYTDKETEENISRKVIELKKQYNLSKIIFFTFSCIKLAAILKCQSSESSWDYKINYIRNIRYVIVEDIWKYLDLYDYELLIEQSSAYIVDFDNEFLGDVNSLIKKVYGKKSLVFSWNSQQSPNKEFPLTLSSTIIDKKAFLLNHPYKVVKAGFTVLAPGILTKIFLTFHRTYSIGDDMSLIYMRLFTFYFSDQVAMLLALRELKDCLPEQYKSKIGWIDIFDSDIVNLSREKAKCMWYPKGISLTNEKNGHNK